jgi:hypothetical protein
MLDLVFVLVTIVVFALALAYVAGCERLQPEARASARPTPGE